MTPSICSIPSVTNKPLPFTNAAPAVCRAGYFQFSGNQHFTNSSVQSRALFWCKSGKGHFILNGVRYEIEPHDLYILPWNRNITYVPDSDSPMYTGHIHLVPWYKPGSPWIPNIAHEVDEVLYDSEDRGDIAWPGFEKVVHRQINARDPIGLLIDYTIRNYLETHGKDETLARSLGLLILNEMERLKRQNYSLAQNHPEELVRMVAHINNAYQLAPTITKLAELIGRSQSHVLKLFRNHLGVSAKNYIINCQLQKACECLISTSTPIAEVGQSVGINDPYHFSKLFRRHIGIAPSEYRLRHTSRLALSKASKTQR